MDDNDYDPRTAEEKHLHEQKFIYFYEAHGILRARMNMFLDIMLEKNLVHENENPVILGDKIKNYVLGAATDAEKQLVRNQYRLTDDHLNMLREKVDEACYEYIL